MKNSSEKMKMKIYNFFNIDFYDPKWYVPGALIFRGNKDILESYIKCPVFPRIALFYSKLGIFTLTLL